MKIDMYSSFVSQLKTAESSAKSAMSEEQEGQLKLLLTRIKNARISKDSRHRLTKMVRELAVNDRLDAKSVKSVIDLIFIEEMTFSEKNEKKGFKTIEKQVEEEIKDIKETKVERLKQKDDLDELKKSLNISA
ncbi:MAG TPA: hypothetical protein PLQ76_01145 [bacterium]|nr:hypothetical protein [bacterium]